MKVLMLATTIFAVVLNVAAGQWLLAAVATAMISLQVLLAFQD
jgi:hypothetical protein